MNGDSGEMVMSDTCLLLCVLMSKSAGCRLAVRQVNASGFHANVWNEHGTDTGWGWEENVGWEQVKQKKRVREISSWAAWRKKKLVSLQCRMHFGWSWQVICKSPSMQVTHATLWQKRWKCTLSDGSDWQRNNTVIPSAFHSTKEEWDNSISPASRLLSC